jgi:hypothetical protein
VNSLLARLTEPRVRRIIEPLIAGDDMPGDDLDDDLAYVRAMGLVARTRPVRIANPIYREVIVRVLASAAEESVTADPQSFVLPDGRLAFNKLLGAFAAFWQDHGAALQTAMPYPEAAPQLVLMAFFQRIVNGGEKQGLEQLDGYLGLRRLARGVLVIFDRRKPRRVAVPRFEDTTTPSGRAVRLLRA